MPVYSMDGTRIISTKPIMITTGYGFEGYYIADHLGLVVSSSQHLFNSDSNVVTAVGASKIYSDQVLQMMDSAMEEMIESASRRGANAILGVSFDFVPMPGTTIMGTSHTRIICNAIGTAVSIIEDKHYAEGIGNQDLEEQEKKRIEELEAKRAEQEKMEAQRDEKIREIKDASQDDASALISSFDLFNKSVELVPYIIQHYSRLFDETFLMSLEQKAKHEEEYGFNMKNAVVDLVKDYLGV